MKKNKAAFELKLSEKDSLILDALTILSKTVLI